MNPETAMISAVKTALDRLRKACYRAYGAEYEGPLPANFARCIRDVAPRTKEGWATALPWASTILLVNGWPDEVSPLRPWVRLPDRHEAPDNEALITAWTERLVAGAGYQPRRVARIVRELERDAELVEHIINQVKPCN